MALGIAPFCRLPVLQPPEALVASVVHGQAHVCHRTSLQEASSIPQALDNSPENDYALPSQHHLTFPLALAHVLSQGFLSIFFCVFFI